MSWAQMMIILFRLCGICWVAVDLQGHSFDGWDRARKWKLSIPPRLTDIVLYCVGCLYEVPSKCKLPSHDD